MESRPELLRTIPGVGLLTSQVFIAQTGADMTRFGSPERLSAWAGLAPTKVWSPTFWNFNGEARPPGSHAQEKGSGRLHAIATATCRPR